MTDEIEQLIQQKGLSAPRVTPAKLQEVIVSEHYFTAREGVKGATGNPPQRFDDVQPLGLLTFCVLVLRNGFTVTGESACASPDNFDAEVGRAAARRQAENKIWPLEGYLLKEELHRAS